MRTTFVIHYAAPGTRRVQVVIEGDVTDLDRIGRHWWEGSVDLDGGETYRYRVVEPDGSVIDEETGPARVLGAVTAPTTIVDRYRPFDPTRRARESALFTRAVASRHPVGASPRSDRVTFRLHEPAVPRGYRPAIVGASEQLGWWDAREAMSMVPAPFPWWQAAVPVSGSLEYKYVLLDDEDKVHRWEEGANRVVPATEGRTRVCDDEFRGLPGFRGAGVAVPVSALRSERSLGVGQFTDLIPLADWAGTVGLTVIQMLPVNDTVLGHGWKDSYPYNPSSVQALHPMYVDLEEIGGTALAAEIEDARARLADGPAIDYPAVMAVKLALLRSAYEIAGDDLDRDDAFVDFVDAEWDWLGPYSLWATLRDRHSTPDTTRWGDDAHYAVARLADASTPGTPEYDDLRFHWFVQYHLTRQLTAASDHARSRGVALKGDLPIGVSPLGVDVWTQPDLFHVGAQTGAPPDAFTVYGQNWKFPTYNWKRMAADGYRWWRDRFAALAAYVDLYRIDHVLGFFRIWEVPPDADDGVLGHFRPALPLSPRDLVEVLGDIDLEGLATPLADEALLERLFGAEARDVADRYFVATDDGLRLRPEVATQRQILEHLGEADGERSALARGLLDAATEVLLLEIDGGYQPRIDWQKTLHYRRLPENVRARVDEISTDYFHHRHRELWVEQGLITLPAVTGSTNLLTCGEDLGMVPDFVPSMMNDMGLLSLEIERMPKRLGTWMADPSDAPYLSVVSPGTHDMRTLRLWWEDDREAAQRLWAEVLGRTGEAPEELSPDVAEHLVRRQLASPAMLAILPIADLLAIDGALRADDAESEWINDPADRHNKWQYRMHLSIEDLAGADRFNAWIKWLFEQSGR